jgi:hypothetical protein
MATQIFDDGSSIDTFDDGSTLATDTAGATTSSDATDVITVEDSSPVSGLSGAVDDITSTVGDAVTAVGDTIGDLVKGVAGGVSSLLGALSGMSAGGATSAVPNPLHGYASYTYSVAIGCLDAKSFNYPLTSYMKGKLPPFIFKSGGKDPNNRINSAWGKNEFYLDSLKINGQYGFQKATGNTNSTNMEFTIVEPYSMGQFITVCQQAAFEQGYTNYNEAPYLLMIEFYGSEQNGQMRQIPGTKKFIPFRFNKIEMKVTASGSYYACEGYVYNGAGLTTEYNQLKSTVTLTGATVQEILQTGQNSLQTILNNRFNQIKTDGGVAVQDEILILFPTNIATSASGQLLGTPGANASKEDSTKPTIDPTKLINDPTLFQQLGVSRGTATATLVQGDGATNVLGKAKMSASELLDGKDRPITKTDKMLDNAGNYVQSKVISKPGYVDMKFTKGVSVIDVINQVMIRSKYGVDALNEKPDANGMRPWWRIDVQVYHSTDKSNNPYTGTVPKLVVYRVVPYKWHASQIIAPGTPPPGIPQLKKQAVKVYDYIYSGKNVDILRFDFTMNQSWYQMGSADLGNKTGDGKLKGQIADEANSKKKESNKTVVPTGGNTTVGSQPGQVSKSAIKFGSDGQTGSRGETWATRTARMFHDALTDGSDLQNLTMDIIGDPYYIANSGMGNFTDSSQTINLTKGGDINYQSSEVDIVVNFRTPIDINQSTGLYNFGNTKIVNQFSGLIKLVNLVSTFKDGKFTQTIEGYRRRQQDLPGAPKASSTPTAKEAPVAPISTTYTFTSPTQTFDDGSSIQTFDDGSTLVTASDGTTNSTPAKG